MFENFGSRLREALETANLTQKAVAEKLGITPQAMNNYVNGRIPETTILFGIAKLCSVSMEWLLTGEGDAPNKEKILTTEVETYSEPINDTFIDGQLISSSSLKGCLTEALAESFSALQQRTGMESNKKMLDEDEMDYLSEKINAHLQRALPKNPMLKYLNELILPFDELRIGPTKENIMLLITLLEKELINYKDESAVIPEMVNEYEMKLLYNYRKLNERSQGEVDNFVRERLCEGDITIRKDKV